MQKPRIWEVWRLLQFTVRFQMCVCWEWLRKSDGHGLDDRSVHLLPHTDISILFTETVGVCQANKDNITFRAAHKTWNAIYRKGSFQNMALLAVREKKREAGAHPEHRVKTTPAPP